MMVSDLLFKPAPPLIFLVPYEIQISSRGYLSTFIYYNTKCFNALGYPFEIFSAMSDVSYAPKKIRPGFYSAAPQSCSADIPKHAIFIIVKFNPIFEDFLSQSLG